MARWLIVLAAAVVVVGSQAQVEPAAGKAASPPSGSAAELAGLWEARRVFVPEARGTLLLRKRGAEWHAEIAGKAVVASVANGRIGFDLPRDAGKFRGDLSADQTKIKGHWIQPGTDDGGPYASPVVLTKKHADEWSGPVTPVETGFTFYLKVSVGVDGSVKALLRNPERNLGFMQYKADHLAREGDVVRLLGRQGKVVSEGRYDRENDRISLYFPTRGGTYDFRRVGEQEPSHFYPRGRPTAAYSYQPPPAGRDGWHTASLGDVGIDQAAIEAFIRKLIANSIDSTTAPEIHGVLIARHGKLVLEEYFHGEHREKPHDLRSAGKSLASDMAGAAIQAGYRLDEDSRVYEVMNGGTMPPGLEPRKRALTLRHLLTMTSGLDCDEDDENSPGHEDNVKGPDVYRATMDLPMAREPGDKAIYCSVGANLAGGVVARAVGVPSLALFEKLIAEPLEIERYYMGVSSMLDYYLGGGARLLPRDFLKLAQVHLNGGTWNGRRVYSADWSRRATAPLVRFSEESKARYGYLWWVYDFQYEGKTVRAYFASGNGGQLSIGIDELDLAVVFQGGNYNDWETGLVALRHYLPQHILPAVRAPRRSIIRDAGN